MHDNVVTQRGETANVSTRLTSTQSSPLATVSADSNSPAPPSKSSNDSRNVSKASPKNTNLAHQAALRRLNARQIPSKPQHEQQDSSQPVLVNPAPTPDMRTKNVPRPKSRNSDSPRLPSPNDFSFDEILSSIGPDAHAAIDAIAEICGRSKLSLADQHGSHMPPQGEVEALPIARTETLATGARDGPQTRSMARKLTVARDPKEAVSGNATAATSTVVSHTHVPREWRRSTRAENNSRLVSQVMAWLGGSENAENGGREVGAATALHRLLDDSETART